MHTSSVHEGMTQFIIAAQENVAKVVFTRAILVFVIIHVKMRKSIS